MVENTDGGGVAGEGFIGEGVDGVERDFHSGKDIILLPQIRRLNLNTKYTKNTKGFCPHCVRDDPEGTRFVAAAPQNRELPAPFKEKIKRDRTMFCPYIMITEKFLFSENHFLDFGVVGGFQAVEVDAAWEV